MGRTRVFDLKRDSGTLLRQEWLSEGEWLRECQASWGLAGFEGMQRPYPTSGQVWGAVGRFLLRIPAYLFVAWIVVLVSEAGGDFSGSGPKRPAAIVWGDGLATRAGSLATSALRRHGIWALTDRRMAFLGLRARTRTRLFSVAPTPGKPHEDYRPVPIETVAEFSVSEWRYEGTVERLRTTRILKRTKSMGTYHRIVFADGSGVDILKG